MEFLILSSQIQPTSPLPGYLILLIPAFMLLAIIGLAGLVYYSRMVTLRIVKESGSRIRQLQTDNRIIVQTAQSFSPQDPEPFGALAKTLQAQVDESQALLQSLQNHYVDLRSRISKNSTFDLKTLPQTPGIWLQLLRLAKNLSAEADSLQEQISSAQETLNATRAQGWATATAVRQVQAEMRKIHELVQQMRRLNFQGVAFDEAARQKSLLLVNFSDIPETFLDDDEQGIQAKADKDSIIRVFRLVTDNQDQVTNLSNRLSAWEKLFRDSKTALSDLQRHNAGLEETLASLPPEIDSQPLLERSERLRQASTGFSQELSQPDPERLAALLREIGQFDRTAKDLHDQASHIQAQWKSFQTRLESLGAELATFQQRVQKLARTDEVPVDWDHTYPQLSELRKGFATLTNPNTGRSVEQLDTDLAHLARMEEEFNRLVAQVQEVEDQRAQLIDLLSAISLDENRLWLQDTTRLYEKATRFGLDNWPRRTSLPDFGEQLRRAEAGLEKLAAAVVPGNQPQSIRENNFVPILVDARRLVENLYQLQLNEKSIGKRYQELEQQEDEARQILENTRVALNQLERLSRANQILEKIALNQVETWIGEADQALVSLDTRHQGAVSRKLALAQTWARGVEKTANQWSTQLEQDLSARHTQLARQVESLQTVALLDEPALQNALKELSSGAANPPGSASGVGKRTPLPVGEVPLKIKQNNQAWQQAVALASALAEIEQPVMDAADQASAQHEMVTLLINQTNALITGKTGWPPASVSLDEETEELNSLDNNWNMLRQTSMRAIVLVSKLVDLAHRYENLTARVKRKADQAVSDQQRVNNLEHQIQESFQLWRLNLKRFSRQEMAYLEIQRLLVEGAADLEQLRFGYAQGSSTYPLVVQDLILLSRKVNHARVTIDEFSSIDINGQILSDEQPERR